MIDWDARDLAAAAGAKLLSVAEHAAELVSKGPARVVIDSREVGAGDLFVGLRGTRADGGEHASDALASGAWGVLVSPAIAARVVAQSPGAGVVLAHADPLHGLQQLAHAWRERLTAQVVGITGSTGKTSTKDILAALLAGASPRAMRTVASPKNFNTEIGLPLAILGAPRDTEALVLEMAMRGSGQIAELVAIARPDVGLIVNVGPVHLEQLGSREAVAAAKAELIEGLLPGSTVVIPANEPLLAPYRREDLRTLTFGEGADVELVRVAADGEAEICVLGRTISLRPSFSQAYNLRNLLAAVAVAHALGVEPAGQLDVSFSALRGERLELPGGVLLINDCYNANPMSMRAALDDLAAAARGRRVAVLGDMLELGPEELSLHREIGEHAARTEVDLVVTVGTRAQEMRAGVPERSTTQVISAPSAVEAAKLLPGLLRAGDTVLVKGSRGMRLEQVAAALGGTAEGLLDPVGGGA